MPAAAASSTAYWISGLSTIGSISFGLALVTGRKRLPMPATGNTAFLSFAGMSELFQQGEQLRPVDHLHAERARLVELAARLVARHHVVRLLRYRARHLVPFRLDRRPRFLARHPRESTSQDEGLGCFSVTRRGGFDSRPAHARSFERFDDL